jgi:hypothetical protein
LKKLEREQEDDFDSELKRFQQEQNKQYKIKKDAFKKVKVYSILSNSLFLSFQGDFEFINTIKK